MKTNRFFVPTRIFSLLGTIFIGFCYLLKNNKSFPKINSLVYILTIYCLVMFTFYFMNEIIYYVKKKLNLRYTKTFEVKEKIKKVKKKRPSYKNVKIEVEQYSIIPSLFLIVISVILMIFTFEPGVKNNRTGFFYFVNIPIFITSFISLLITLASNLKLEWLKTTYIVLTFVSILFGYICLITF